MDTVDRDVPDRLGSHPVSPVEVQEERQRQGGPRRQRQRNPLRVLRRRWRRAPGAEAQTRTLRTGEHELQVDVVRVADADDTLLHVAVREEPSIDDQLQTIDRCGIHRRWRPRQHAVPGRLLEAKRLAPPGEHGGDDRRRW